VPVVVDVGQVIVTVPLPFADAVCPPVEVDLAVAAAVEMVGAV
jgi:hypothetical protein